ncbi:protein transport protein S31 [Mortierella sp. AD011]|nr:protein transport protein S31 [Mortierella sp. AD010]KAF9402110.1 protein transport protein S31 [Mortierella sp. AD011]
MDPSIANPPRKDNEENKVDEADDKFSVDRPVWASETSTTSQDLAPPPTYDPSAFSAPLNALPTFKPRKSNRVSVLSYSTDATTPPMTSNSPPPATGPAGTTPPPGGIKLPPPPMKGAGSGPAPIPYTKGDFRTAEIVNHWNDPPTQIFEKGAKNGESTAYDFGPMNTMLTAIIKECSANVPAPQKRMFEDTTKRLQVLQDQMNNGTVNERVVTPLGDMIQALSSRSFAQCLAIHAKLMQTEFESEGKWLLGFKRLIDLYASLPPPS